MKNYFFDKPRYQLENNRTFFMDLDGDQENYEKSFNFSVIYDVTADCMKICFAAL